MDHDSAAKKAMRLPLLFGSDLRATSAAIAALSGLVARSGTKQKLKSSPIAPLQRNKIGRNAICPCGSGRKYKHCCLRRAN